MDPLKRQTRPAGDYISRGLDPQAGVPVARAQREAQQFTLPGGRVPNNPMVATGVEQELFGAPQAYSNPYGDWRAMDPAGTMPSYQRVKPTSPAGRMMSPQKAGDSEGLGELRWAGQAGGSGGPLALPASDVTANPGIAAEVGRYNDMPVGRQLPANQPPAMEDLQWTQTPMPSDADPGFTAMVIGDPSQASLPRPKGSDTTPTAGGRQARSPRPA